MSDIEAFLRARLEEDKQQAMAASPGPWRLNAEHDEVIAVDDIEVCTAFALSNNQLRNTARFIARHDPEAVLSDIKLKLDLLDLWIEAGKSKDFTAQSWVLLREIVYAIAALYSDHPDHDPKWKPIFGTPEEVPGD